MAIEMDFFPHPADHCNNDALMAHLTIWLLAAFTVVLAVAIIVGCQGL
jgi:hypothetical protein